MTTHTPEQALKPCPFCGSSDVTITNGIRFRNVFCKVCDCVGPDFHDQADAVAAWNRRATAQPAAFDEGRERAAFESEFGSKPTDSLAGLIWAGQIQGYLARARGREGEAIRMPRHLHPETTAAAAMAIACHPAAAIPPAPE